MDQRYGEKTKDEEHFSAAEMLQLRQLQMLSSLQERLESWIKNRFRTALFAVSVSGFLGIQAIGYVVIDQALGSKIDDANIQSAILEKTAAALESEAQVVKTRAKEALSTAEEQQRLITRKLAELESQASVIDQKLRVTLTKADAVSQRARFATLVDVEGLQAQIDSIVSAASVPNQEQVKAETERRKKSFYENAGYAINVHYLADREKDARSAIERMRVLGFEVRDTASSNLPDDSSKGRKSIGILRDKYGINSVISPDQEKGQYVATMLANEFPDWEFIVTADEGYGRSSTNIVFWGINIVFL